jgi:hypothetical protein
MDKNTAIKAIQGKLEKLKSVQTSEQFNIWQNSTILTLVNIYSEKDKRVIALEAIQSYTFHVVSGIDRTQKAIVAARELLESLITDIQDFDIPSKIEHLEKHSGVNVHVNQSNNQSQTTNTTIKLDFFIEIIKDELKGGQVKELKEILDYKDETVEKKKQFIDKIKSYGADVASNILANLLTNPEVYKQLGRML